MIYLIIILLIALDQCVKLFSIEFLKNSETLNFIPNILHLRYIENTGAAFSMLEGQTWFFVLITILCVIFGFYVHMTNKIRHKVGYLAFILIMAGAVGNLIDRLLYGFVVDMFELKFINFAIFNVADIYITIGGFILCYYILFLHEKSIEKGDINE